MLCLAQLIKLRWVLFKQNNFHHLTNYFSARSSVVLFAEMYKTIEVWACLGLIDGVITLV